MNYYKNSKALDTIKKRRISIILQDPENNICFDCSQLNPEYISINNAIFICKNCAQIHSKLNNSVSNIINNNLNNLSMKNIQYLSYGGNKNLKEFIKNNFPDLNILSPSYFYNTYAMEYYRKMIEYLVEGGTKPVKPEENKGYELMSKIREEIGKQSIESNFEKNKRNNRFIKKIKSYSLI
jgi:small-conductance mechanosensitive channel